MNFHRFTHRSTRSFALLTLAISSSLIFAQEDAPPKATEKPMMMIPNVIDKLLATEQTLRTPLGWNTRKRWTAEYKSLYQEFHKTFTAGDLENKSRAHLALMLGIKASDGVLALRAQDLTALNACSEEISRLARKLGVPDSSLAKANLVKRHAENKRWLEAFMELGYLQQSVMLHLEGNKEQKDEFLLVVMGSWFQGGFIVSKLILKAHSEQSSNILREPKLVDIMISEFNDMRPDYLKEPVVKAVQDILPKVKKILDVPLHAKIAETDVKWLQDEFKNMVDLISKSVTSLK